MTAAKSRARPHAFIVTKEHRRFVEFANAVRRYRYIGLCFGAAGVGKTVSARRYANWQQTEPLLLEWGNPKRSDKRISVDLAKARTVFYTPMVSTSVGRLRRDVSQLLHSANACIDLHGKRGKTPEELNCLLNHIELVIIDEAERLPVLGLEYLRDLFDRSDIGLILIGMPGIEKRMARYPQLYSRVGFAHHYRHLQGEELSFVLTRHWRKLGLQLDGADFTDSQAMTAIARITSGNFRLLQRLFVQIGRVLRINELTLITEDVVEVARSTLVIGAN